MNPPPPRQSTPSVVSSATWPASGHGSALVATTVVQAFLCVAPSLGRSLWVLGVRCEFCSVEGIQSLHVHRAEDPHGVVRRARCGRGIYEIVPPPMNEWVT